MPRGWAEYAKHLLPFAASAGIIITATQLPADPSASPEAILASIVAGLLANGLSALCKLHKVIPDEYQQALPNSDILQLIRTSWGEAAKAALKAYLAAYNELSIINGPVTKEFRRAVANLHPADFTGREINLATVHAAIDETRRSLLSEHDQVVALDEKVKDLRAGLVNSILETLKYVPTPAIDIPPDLPAFLEGPNGVLKHLVIHVAFYMKTDQRSRDAVMSFTEQEITHSQEKLEKLCNRILESQNAMEQSIIKAFVDGLAATQRALLQRFDDQYRPELDPPFTSIREPVDFTYRARVTGFVGREEAIKALIDFLADPREGLWTVITGPAGSGKSRLAAELVAMAGGRDGRRWYAGFVRNGAFWLQSHAVKWRRDTDALLIIDYASDFDIRYLGDFLAHLSTESPAFRGRIRVILLDRLPPNSDLGVASRVIRGAGFRSDIVRNRWTPPEPSPLALNPLTEKNALQLARTQAGVRWNRPAEERVVAAVRKDRELARPLFAFLIGDAISNGDLPEGVLNPVTVTEHALTRIESHGASKPLRDAWILWATATTCQGVSEDHLFAMGHLQNLTGHSWAYADLPYLEEHVRALSLSSARQETVSTRRYIVQLEPDFMGGLFVLRYLLRLSEDAMKRAAKSMMTFSWKYGVRPDEFISRMTSDFIGRIEQLAEAFGETRDLVHQLLVSLVCSGLSPEGLGRDAGSSVGHCAFLAAKAGQTSIGFEFVTALETAYMDDPQSLAVSVAEAWFGLALAKDLPSQSPDLVDRALKRIGELALAHDIPKVRLQEVRALYNGISREHDRDARWRLVERLWETERPSDTDDVALERARGLYTCLLVEEDSIRRETLASRIGNVREKHNTDEIALLEANALYNLTSVNAGSKWKEIAERIGRIRQDHNTPEIALHEATAYNHYSHSSRASLELKEQESIAGHIEEMLQEHRSSEMAMQYAQALLFLIAVQPTAEQRYSTALRIGDIRAEFNTEEIAGIETRALIAAGPAPAQ